MKIEVICKLPRETEETFITVQGEPHAVREIESLLRVKTKVVKVNTRPDVLKKKIRGDWLG